MTKLPQATDAEKALLGCMLLAPKRVIGEFLETGSIEFFHSFQHQCICRHMLALWNKGTAIDLTTVTASIDDVGATDDIGGSGYITEVFNFVNVASNSKYYMDILREKWVQRKSLEIAKQIEDAASNGSHGKLQEVVSEGLVRISSMFESRAKTHQMEDLVMRALDRCEDIRNGGKIPGILTGIKALDEHTRGLQPGQMITIAAPTKGGKSAFALNVATHNVLQGIPVALFSLEMNADELTDRLLSSHSEVDLGRLAKGGINSHEVDRLVKAGANLSGTPLFIRDEAVMSPTQFRAAARKMHVQHGVKLMIVDYIQLMDPDKESDNREREVAKFSRTIKTTASELGIPIIVLAQLNMDGRSRESRAIEQDSNLFLVIQEDEMGEMCINVKYSRSCPRGKIPVNFRREILKFEQEAQ